MLSLRELQQSFCAALYEGKPSRPLGVRSWRGLDEVRRLGFYRSSMFGILGGALAEIYPATRKLVGVEFFEFMTRRYIPGHPSRSGDLHAYGEAFATFIDVFEPARELVYLGDVARLEWAVHRVFHAAERAPLSLDALARVPAAQHATLSFVLHPAVRLLESAYPVHRIWQVNLPNREAESVGLGEGRALLIVRRPRFDVEVVPLAPGDFAFLQSLADGAGLQQACEAALRADDCFEPGVALPRFVQSGTLVDFQVETDVKG